MGTVQSPSYRNRVSYQAMLLGGFSMLASALLIIGNMTTVDVIAERNREDLIASLSQVIPESLYDNSLISSAIALQDNDKTVTVYRGAQGFQISALAWVITGSGYAGDIKLILGLDETGEILGVRTLSHAETPGLGDKIEVAKDDWILAFNGLSLINTPRERWKVDKDGGDFDAFSGATVTPRAVVAAIVSGLDFYYKHKNALLEPLRTTTDLRPKAQTNAK